ncbi:MAG: hypothetical protein ABIW47_15685 [Ginsengibacter sp.]
MANLHSFIKRIFFILLFSGFAAYCPAQTDTEFPKGFILYAKLHNGLITDFTSGPDLYVGGLQLAPQYTVVPHLLRAGIVAGGFYENKKIQGEIGPSLSLKLKTFNANLKGAGVGSLGNLNLMVDHLWGTGKQRLLGGGIILDAGNIITFGLTAHRDYRQNNWWFQSEVAIRISKKRKIPEI